MYPYKDISYKPQLDTFFLGVLQASPRGQDRLMQDILDRGLGSEDRKTLRKLASVGGRFASGRSWGEVDAWWLIPRLVSGL